MLGVLLGLGALALAPRALGDTPLLPSGDPPRPGGTVYLLRPVDFVHPSERAAVSARGGDSWVVTRAGSFEGKRFRTAKEARIALTAAGFRGPYGRGTASRWTR